MPYVPPSPKNPVPKPPININKKRETVDYGYATTPKGSAFDKRQKAFLKQMQKMNKDTMKKLDTSRYIKDER